MNQRDSIEFYYNNHGTISSKTNTGHYDQLSSWLTSDIQEYAPDCLWALAMVEEVKANKSNLEQWSGNSALARITPRGVEVRDIYPENSRPHDYSLEEAHAVILEYFRFIAPDPTARDRALVVWEKEHGRVHPCRSHLA